MTKGIHIESTPASRWAQRYKKRYWYNFGGALIFIGLFSLIVSKPIGISIMVIGGCVIYGNYRYWKDK